MKNKNMDKLVKYLSEFIKNKNFMYSPHNTQYSFYLEIFLDEANLHIDRFDAELVRRLIDEEQILELDSNNANYSVNNQHQCNYDLFYNTWYSWNILYDVLQEKNLIL